MKRIRFIMIVMLLFLLCGCNENGSIYDSTKIKVSIIDSYFFTAETSNSLIDMHSDFNTVLTMRDGYVFQFCSYENYFIEQLDDSHYSITFKDVTRPVRVKIYSERVDKFVTTNESFSTKIRYYYNDGTEDYKEESYTLSYHIRQNTWNAKDLKRNGYTLYGWNTKSDLSGDHIGLGSRATVEKDETLSLYAEWVPWTSASQFNYKRNVDDTLSLTCYTGAGTANCISIPEYIDGYVVKEILSSFTTNMPCGTIKSKIIVIPNSVEYIHNNAFLNCAFEEIYFSDNLAFESNSCFKNNISYYHINAYETPRLQAKNYNVRFADNIDILIRYQESKKLILFGGCNFSFGLYSPMVEKEFSNYKVVNCGLNGEFNALFQIEIIQKFLSSGDIFVHCPEEMNGNQFLTRLLVDFRIFEMVEGNYDLLAYSNFAYSKYVLEAYNEYNSLRLTYDECSYSDNPGLFNTYGDYLDDRDYDERREASKDIMYTEGYIYDLDLLNSENIWLLGGKYNEISDMGVDVYFTYSPMNYNSCEQEIIYEKAEAFDQLVQELLKPFKVKIISKATDYIYKGRFFFDTDYHMNFYGSEIRTEQLIKDLKEAGVK